MARFFLTGLTTLLLCCATSSTMAQEPATPPDLNNPEVLLETARSTNGLSGELKTPWHLKASYEVFSDDGKPLGKGVFEEWWAAKDKWKQSYTGDHFTGVIYHAPEGVASVGQVPWPEILIADALISPIKRDFPKNAKAKPPSTVSGATPALSCLDLSSQLSETEPGTVIDTPIGNAYCFDAGTAILRLRKDDFVAAAYARTGLFEGRHVGIDTTIQVNRQVLANVHIDTLTTVAAMTPDAYSPGEATQFTPYRNGNTAGITPPRLVESTDPEFSRDPHARPMPGRVVARIIVGTNGRVSGVRVLESPNDASGDAVVKALRQYRFKAAQLGGQPVPTEIKIVINIKVPF